MILPLFIMNLILVQSAIKAAWPASQAYQTLQTCPDRGQLKRLTCWKAQSSSSSSSLAQGLQQAAGRSRASQQVALKPATPCWGGATAAVCQLRAPRPPPQFLCEHFSCAHAKTVCQCLCARSGCSLVCIWEHKEQHILASFRSSGPKVFTAAPQ